MNISNRVGQIARSAIHEMTRLSKQYEDVAFLSWAKPTSGTPKHINDAVILPTPTYATHITQVRLASGKPVFVPLQEENKYKLDTEAISRSKSLCHSGCSIWPDRRKPYQTFFLCTRRNDK